MNALGRSAAAKTCTPDPAVGTMCGSTSGPAPAVPGRLEASVSTPAAGAAAAASTATAPTSRPGRPGVATSSSTSAGGPLDPPGAAEVEAGVPREAKSRRSAGLEVLGDPAALLSGVACSERVIGFGRNE